MIDTSAFVAMMAREPEAEEYATCLASASSKLMSAGNYLESAMVAEGRFGGRLDLERWLSDQRVDIVPVDRVLAEIAADAFARYGKGRHPAGLNYGDCFAYALAKQRNAPLLFKGNDFSRTDIAAALV